MRITRRSIGPFKPGNWLNNPSFHGFTEMLYENTSANANNGSGFEGLGDNNIFLERSNRVYINYQADSCRSLVLLPLQVYWLIKNIYPHQQVR